MTQRVVYAALFAALISSCTKQKANSDMQMTVETVAGNMKALSGKRIFFGHQSVGMDIMEGVEDLQQTTGSPRLNLIRRGTEALPAGGWFIDTLIGRNADPKSKCDAFREAVERYADSLDFALMKFCYVDIKESTDIDEMFSYYVATVDSLKRDFPHVTLIHATVPLTERSPAWRRWTKKILGKTDVWESAALKRATFNKRVLEHFKNEPVFDLAGIESTYPDGSRCSYESNGEQVFTLVSDYTRDGGHLNETGRIVVAKELLNTLAEIARRSKP